MGQAIVAIAKGAAVEEQVRRAVGLLGGMSRFVKPGGGVMLKPNATGPATYDKGVTTNPRLLEAVLKLVYEAGAGKVVVADGTGSATLGTLKVFELCGYAYLKEKYHFDFFDLNRDRTVAVSVKKPYILEQIQVAASMYQTFDTIINLPVMKTHFITGVSLGMKNLKGCIPPREKRLMHDVGVNKAVADLNTILKTDLTIVDGTVASEGLGPKEGNPVGMETVVAGADVVAVDSVCCSLMGFEAGEIEHIRMVYERGIGEINPERIEIRGDTIAAARRRFAPAIPKIPEGDLAGLINGSACSGCISCAVIALSRLVDSGILARLKERGVKISFAIGPRFKPDQAWPDAAHTFILGNCCKKMAAKGQFIPGCAPGALDVNRFICAHYGVDPTVLESIVGQVGK